MLRQLLRIFRADSDSPLAVMGRDFGTMLGLARDNTLAASEIFFRAEASPEERSRIYAQDVQINKLERVIRRKVVAHLSFPDNHLDAPYCLLLMSLVKDVERIGDYAKNLAEVVDIHPGTLPEDDLVEELQEIRTGVEDALRAVQPVFDASDRERALQYISQGRGLAHRCDTLIARNARSSHDAATTTAIVLGIRYYKRIGGHVLNVLSSVVMPIDKLDYHDEDAVRRE
jgi:phosphate uptake regulator